ncbi:MAG TPA: gamma carbonic anhydrase family protein [Anaerolineae bacterium]|nr:gamma carbonic anhydrase family protein [Anaerolineae bacterium]
MDTRYHPELIDPSAFVAPDARIVGQVTVGPESSVWFGSVLRGDTDRVVIGTRTNLQDGCIVHVDAGSPAIIGSGVTVAHRAVVHGCTVEDDVLIGMGAILLSGARIGRESIVGAGALVTGGTVVPARSLVLGLPGRVVRRVTDEELLSVRDTARRYAEYARRYRTGE